MCKKKMTSTSPRSTAATRLRSALTRWQPPHCMGVETMWSPRAPDPTTDRVHRVSVTIRRRESNKGDTERVQRSRSITVTVVADPGIEPAEVLQALDEVADALLTGIEDAKEAAAERGLAVTALEVHDRRWFVIPRPPEDHPALLANPSLFRRVPGWSNYDVSPSGIVRSYYSQPKLVLKTPRRVLKPRWNDNVGDFTVTLFDGKSRTAAHRSEVFTIEELIAMTWGPGTSTPSFGVASSEDDYPEGATFATTSAKIAKLSQG